MAVPPTLVAGLRNDLVSAGLGHPTADTLPIIPGCQFERLAFLAKLGCNIILNRRGNAARSEYKTA